MRISDWSSDVCSSDLRLARAVGVERAHRAVMAGVHRGQHVEALRSANFAQDDAVRPHTQGVDDKIADGDGAIAFQIGGARLQRQHMRLLKPKLGCVLDGDRSEEHTSELQSLMRISYAVFCLKKKK